MQIFWDFLKILKKIAKFRENVQKFCKFACEKIVFLKILKNAAKCVFGRENRRWSSRERASERVIMSTPRSLLAPEDRWERISKMLPSGESTLVSNHADITNLIYIVKYE